MFLVHKIIEPKRRNFIVYVNPFGGQGKAMSIYNQHVKPLFAEAEIQHVVVKTGKFFLLLCVCIMFNINCIEFRNCCEQEFYFKLIF